MKINIKIFQTIGVVVMSSCLIAGGFVFFAQTTRAQSLLPAYQYQITEKSIDPILEVNQPSFLTIKFRNTGSADWPIYQLHLDSAYFTGAGDYPSPFATSVWVNNTTLLLGDPTNRQFIRPGGIAAFDIPIQTPSRTALYQLMFRLDIGSTPVLGETIKWIVQVGNALSYQSAEGKQIQIWLTDQRIWAIENNVVIMDTPISSGKPGYNTPKGKYKILNHITTAYSSPYKLWMDNWMALYSKERGFVGYGLHALPYWTTRQTKYASGTIVDGRLYEGNKVYEDALHLGKTMSHGCVRLGIYESKLLYDWAPNKTDVTISA